MISNLYYVGGSDSTKNKKKSIVGRVAEGLAWGSSTDDELTLNAALPTTPALSTNLSSTAKKIALKTQVQN